MSLCATRPRLAMTNVEPVLVATVGSQKSSQEESCMEMLPFLLCVAPVVAKPQGVVRSTSPVVSELWGFAIHGLPWLRRWAVGTGEREPFSPKAKARGASSGRSQPGNAAFEFPSVGWRGSAHWYAAYCTIFLLILQTHHFLHLIICFKDQKSESVVFAPVAERKTWGPPKSLL